MNPMPEEYFKIICLDCQEIHCLVTTRIRAKQIIAEDFCNNCRSGMLSFCHTNKGVACQFVNDCKSFKTKRYKSGE